MALALRLLLLVGLAIAPALCVVGYNEYALRASRAAELRSQAERSANRAAAEVSHIVAEVERLSAVIAKLPEIRVAAFAAGFSPECSALLSSLRQEYPGQLEFGVANRDGLIVCTTRGASEARPVRGTHFGRAMRANAFVIGGYFESQTAGVKYLTFAYPIRDDAGHPAGAILTGLDLDTLAARMRPLASPAHAVLSVHDRDLVFLARVPDAAGLIGNKPPPQVQALSARANKGAMEATGADGRTRVGAIVSMTLGRDAPERPDLSVAFGLSRDAAFAEIDAATHRSIALLLLSLALAALATWYGGRQFIRRPVERLLAAAERWREGDYTARVALRERSSELGQLATAFEHMAESLERRDRDQRLLIDELNHRVKNTLATVQSLAAQSLRNATNPEVAHRNFEARLLALSKTHNVLTREKWESAPILEIVSDSIEPYAQGAAASRFTIQGPALRLPPTIILPLSMALHELCTNAVKYGSLSNQTGQVAISWELAGTEREARLRFRWAESGGPVVREPSRKGFGTRLIERGLAQQLGGTVDLRFALEGLMCEMEIPVELPGARAMQARAGTAEDKAS